MLAMDDAALAMLRPDAPRVDPPTALDDLVTWKRRELLRIAARDLTGADSLEVTTAALADLAADVLRVVADTTDDVLAPDDRMAIIGMGKLGGTELNYASDVDVLLRRRRGHRAARAQGAGRGRPRGPRLSHRRRPPARRPRRPARPHPRVLRGVLGTMGRAVGAPGAPEGAARGRRSSSSARPGRRGPGSSCGASPSAPTISATSVP